ncbi:hypothetical protein KC19_4G094400 [Ceratodon purpureus]|uniref:Uncharacterized protein n=1 Tax=Ceratodon purpureus TaxID=3225 RepID=A0A8T0I6S8_CERPU|nr:hypothetical protein KC19_4G094400 [Ceratodon purpureus]
MNFTPIKPTRTISKSLQMRHQNAHKHWATWNERNAIHRCVKNLWVKYTHPRLPILQHYMSTIISQTQMTGHVPSAFLIEDDNLGVSLLFSMKLHKSTQVETSVRDTACKVSHGRDMGHVAHA